MTETVATPQKRRPGRPRKVVVEREALRGETATPKYKMRAKPNWEEIDPNAQDTPDRLHIASELIPEGMAALWVTDSVYGQPVPQHRAEFERKGWTPVHQDDFSGQFDGMFMPKGAPGEIKADGLVLMMRPAELSVKSIREDKLRAIEQVQIKEAAMRSGDLPISLDARHSSALATNRITKTLDGAFIPGDKKA
jgi:hypothetical protein